MRPLLADQALERSGVVANCSMNRERGLTGVNSYTRDLGFDVLAFLQTRLRERGEAAWLDLCCGSGRALIEAGQALVRLEAPRVSLLGVDLVPMFDRVPATLDFVCLQASSLAVWEPDRAYDLITCVQGLHYVGDKLELIARAATWLTPDGQFLAHLDPDHLRVFDPALGESAAGPAVLRALRGQGMTYDARKHRLSCTAGLRLRLPYRYLGADDTVGPNYTGQPAVCSVYEAEGVLE